MAPSVDAPKPEEVKVEKKKDEKDEEKTELVNYFFYFSFVCTVIYDDF